MQRSIILFRFHTAFDVCAERIRLLSRLNPDIPIYGLYGGEPEQLNEAQRVLGDLLVTIHTSSTQSARWKWLHPDINLKQWFRTFGHTLDFDYLYDYEWDILTTAPLKVIYPSIPMDSIALCAVTPFTDALAAQWNWTSLPEEKPRFLAFMDYMRDTYNLNSLEYVSLGPGPLLPRPFIEKFSEAQDNDLVLCEIAYPAYAQALGFKVVNNNLRESFFRPDLDQFFNCEDLPILRETIIAENRKDKGVRAFHPVKYLVDAGSFELLA